MWICFLFKVLVFWPSWKIWVLWVTSFCFFTVDMLQSLKVYTRITDCRQSVNESFNYQCHYSRVHVNFTRVVFVYDYKWSIVAYMVVSQQSLIESSKKTTIYQHFRHSRRLFEKILPVSFNIFLFDWIKNGSFILQKFNKKKKLIMIYR